MISSCSTHSNGVNSRIAGWNLTKFVHDVAELLNSPLNPLAADLKSWLDNVVISRDSTVVQPHQVRYQVRYLIFSKRFHDRPIRCRTREQRVKVVRGDVCKWPPKLIGCRSNVL